MEYLTKVIYNGDGVVKNYTVPFKYIHKSHIKVYINNTETTNFIWLNDYTIQFISPPSINSVIRIERQTPIINPLVVYTNTALLKSNDLNLTYLHTLYKLQELMDNIVDLPTIAVDLPTIASVSVNFKGGWSPVISYKKGDIVKGYDNALYICLQDNINQPYYDTNYWLRILSHRYSYTQTAPADVWVINHNLYNENIPLVKVFTQSSGNAIQFTLYPSDTLYCGDWLFCGQSEVVTYSTYDEIQYSEIRKINNNTLHIVFPTPIAGIAEIIL